MVPNVLGGFFKMKSPGILKFAFKGKEYSLQPVDEGDGTLFIIFRDASNLNETYSAGRFLYADKPVNGEAVLDFNKAAKSAVCVHFLCYVSAPAAAKQPGRGNQGGRKALRRPLGSPDNRGINSRTGASVAPAGACDLVC